MDDEYYNLQLLWSDHMMSPFDIFHELFVCPAIVFAKTCHSLSTTTQFAGKRRHEAEECIDAKEYVKVHTHNAHWKQLGH